MLFNHLALTSIVLAVGALASPLSSTHIVHEKRTELPRGWSKRAPLDRRALLPVRIGLTQSNLDKGYDWLSEVSHPDSAKYGQHWTAEEITKAFAPSQETVDTVKEWLTLSGIHPERVSQSQSLSWLKFDATVDEVERLFKADYHVYEHSSNGQPHIATEEYSIPIHLREHIDFVTPTIQFDAKLRSGNYKREIVPGVQKGLGEPGSGSLPKLGPNGLNYFPFPFGDLLNCSSRITPDCLRALYQFPQGFTANPRNSYGIVEYSPQAYRPGDLDAFFKKYSPQQVGQRPILESIDGGVVQQENASFGFNGESDLDLEYAMTLIYPQKVTLYQAGDLVEGASFGDFLDAIDGSYCSYEGGDDPNQDATYPDPAPGGYKGPKDCGKYAATKVISTSYGYNEHDLPPAYEQRQCNEYMKLGLQGVSVLYSSGDYGVAGNGGQCIDGPGIDAPYNSGKSGRFNPSFPATCPYVTAVGATQVKPGTNIVVSEATGTQPEQACETVIYSGGGFSNVFPLPSYQSTAVKSWFANHPPPYDSSRFNNSQTTRGYPDISANGANYAVNVDGNFTLVYGTSASSPVLGSILTLLNEARLNVGKGPVGFINPVAYAHPGVFNDITQGGNQGCGTPGFSSAAGWDPVTGLGTPSYPKMLALWLGLP